MAEQRILESPPLLVRKFVVQPIIGERNGDSDLSAIQKRLDHRSSFPARLRAQLRQCRASGVERIGFSLAIADQRQKSSVYQAAALTLHPCAQLLFGRACILLAQGRFQPRYKPRMAVRTRAYPGSSALAEQ